MKRSIIIILIGALCISYNVNAQTYLGAGNDNGVTISSSSEVSNPDWQGPASASNTFSGDGMKVDYLECSRFLTQASLGFEESHIQDVLSMGFSGWIDDQISKPYEYVTPELDWIWEAVKDSAAAAGQDVSEWFRSNWVEFNYAWWELNMQNEDILRHRVAAALSEILVISKNSDLRQYGDGLASYYDLLLEHAFGNYNELLYDVTLNPMMGFYLSHLNNPKTIPSENISPDENYAREIMQLFTIGLYELNPDGTRQLSGGDPIPTYDQDDIKEFAKVFTGLGVSGGIPNPYNNDGPYFGRGLFTANTVDPMIMYENWHEPGVKYLLNNDQTPNNATGLQDIAYAVNHLCDHPNVGPFIGYRLIQRLVKSNPSPAYVSRITNVWNNNGSGERGDLGAVVKAILLDEEARDCEYQTLWQSSKLKEPMMRYMQFARAVDKSNPNNFFWNVNYRFKEEALQDILYAPSVFNFFTVDYTPVGHIDKQNLVAPEFKIHDSRSSIGYLNNVDRWVDAQYGQILYTWEGQIMENTEVVFVNTDWRALASDPEALINRIDEIFINGKLSDNTRNIIRDALNKIESDSWYDHLEYRVEFALYLALISPDFAIQK